MRTRQLTAGVLALVLAGCSTGAVATPAAEPSQPTAEAAQPTATTAPAPTEAPAATTSALDVKVTFDGETCTYVGPTVVPDGTVLRFDYAPDQAVSMAYLLVYAVEAGTTFQTLLDWCDTDGCENAGDNIPPWVLEETAGAISGPGTMLYTIDTTRQSAASAGRPIGGYQVQCNTPQVFPATQLMVAGS